MGGVGEAQDVEKQMDLKKNMWKKKSRKEKKRTKERKKSRVAPGIIKNKKAHKKNYYTRLAKNFSVLFFMSVFFPAP